jgi:RNA polymerase sigma-70 factor, ECF subfamily
MVVRRIGIPDPSASNSPPEADFAPAFRAGEMAAADRLITSYGSRAYGLARAILEDDEAAQDAASDALRMVLEQRDAAPDEFANAGRWWINVTRLASLDRRRGRLHDANSTRDLVPGVTIDQRAVLSAMLAIPAEQREALSLAYQDGLTVVELARRLKVPVPVVALRLRDALTVISTALAPPETGTANDNAE